MHRLSAQVEVETKKRFDALVEFSSRARGRPQALHVRGISRPELTWFESKLMNHFRDKSIFVDLIRDGALERQTMAQGPAGPAVPERDTGDGELVLGFR